MSEIIVYNTNLNKNKKVYTYIDLKMYFYMNERIQISQ